MFVFSTYKEYTMNTVKQIKDFLDVNHNGNSEVVERVVTFAFLGRGKYTPGTTQSGSLVLTMSTKPHPLSRSIPVKSSLIELNYYDQEGTLQVNTLAVPRFPEHTQEVIEWIDLLLSLENYDNGEEENRTRFIGFDERIHREFVERLKAANRNPKYNARFRTALNVAHWGGR